MFGDSFGHSKMMDDEMSLGAWTPAVDIYESGDGIVLLAELPGVSKENVTVELNENILTLKGERPADPSIKEEMYYRQERAYGTFQRSFTLQQNIQPDLIKAKFKNGVLEIEIPRPKNEQPKQVTVKVK
jgi:HSP20 family protein